MTAIKDLNGLFVHTLRDIFYAEKQILKALPKMSKKAGASMLKKAFEAHLAETEDQVGKLEQVFELLGEKARGVKCEAIEGIIEEAKGHMEDVEDQETLDAALIAGAQAVEHYEITRYGTLIAWSQTLGLDSKVTRLLSDILKQEEATDKKLSELAMQDVNRKAA